MGYLAVAEEAAAPTVSDESEAVAWWQMDHLRTMDPQLGARLDVMLEEVGPTHRNSDPQNEDAGSPLIDSEPSRAAGACHSFLKGSPRASARAAADWSALMGALAAALGVGAVVMFGAMPILGHVSLGYAFVAILLLCGSAGVFALSLLRRRPTGVVLDPAAQRARRLVVAVGALWSIIAVLAGLATIVLAVPAVLARPTAVLWMELAFGVLLVVGAVGWFLAFPRTSEK